MGTHNSKETNDDNNKTDRNRRSTSKTNTISNSKPNENLQNNCNNTPRMIRSPSGAEIGENPHTPFVPIEKLADILKHKSHSGLAGNNGIIVQVFVDEVFPFLPDLGRRLFQYLHTNSKAKTDYLGKTAFRQQCERFLGILDDSTIMEIYIKMFSDEKRPDFIDKQGTFDLLLTSFKITMIHYRGDAKICTHVDEILSAVTKSIFFAQDSLSVGFVARWVESNIPRLIMSLHKFCVHTLSVAYRGLEDIERSFGLELSTPILDSNGDSTNETEDKNLMSLSLSWLLAHVLPIVYSKPQTVSPPRIKNSSSSGQIFKSYDSVIPSHWTLLYNSDAHGLGSNRFLHHVLGYRGPTLILISTRNSQVYCMAAPSEWHETHLYTGANDSRIIQVLPKFAILEKGANILYLNTSIRGYPKGLRAGKDPRKPVLSIHEDFEKIDCKGLETEVNTIEVWGCGNKASREVQLDIKKWQIKEVERQRTVKLTAADWMDHPDRYLLELGGRQNYNN